VFQCVAVRCDDVLQCVAVRCNVLRCVTVWLVLSVMPFCLFTPPFPFPPPVEDCDSGCKVSLRVCVRERETLQGIFILSVCLYVQK